jgi:hypothetical protein
MLYVSIIVPRKGHLATRLLLAMILFYSLIINNTYQGQIITKLNTPLPSKNLVNMEQLLATNFSLFSSFPASTFVPLGDNEDKKLTVHKLAARNTLVNDIDDFLDLFHTRNDIAVLVKDFCAPLIKATTFDVISGEDVVHIIPESPIMLLSAFVARKDSAFLNEFIEAELRAIETGIIHVAVQRFLYHNHLQFVKRYRQGYFGKRRGGMNKITMEHIWALLETCATCYAIAFGLFVLEILWFRVGKKILGRSQYSI